MMKTGTAAIIKNANGFSNLSIDFILNFTDFCEMLLHFIRNLKEIIELSRICTQNVYLLLQLVLHILGLFYKLRLCCELFKAFFQIIKRKVGR